MGSPEPRRRPARPGWGRQSQDGGQRGQDGVVRANTEASAARMGSSEPIRRPVWPEQSRQSRDGASSAEAESPEPRQGQRGRSSADRSMTGSVRTELCRQCQEGVSAARTKSPEPTWGRWCQSSVTSTETGGSVDGTMPPAPKQGPRQPGMLSVPDEFVERCVCQ